MPAVKAVEAHDIYAGRHAVAMPDDLAGSPVHGSGLDRSAQKIVDDNARRCSGEIAPPRDVENVAHGIGPGRDGITLSLGADFTKADGRHIVRDVRTSRIHRALRYRDCQGFDHGHVIPTVAGDVAEWIRSVENDSRPRGIVETIGTVGPSREKPDVAGFLSVRRIIPDSQRCVTVGAVAGIARNEDSEFASFMGVGGVGRIDGQRPKRERPLRARSVQPHAPVGCIRRGEGDIEKAVAVEIIGIIFIPKADAVDLPVGGSPLGPGLKAAQPEFAGDRRVLIVPVAERDVRKAVGIPSVDDHIGITRVVVVAIVSQDHAGTLQVEVRSAVIDPYLRGPFVCAAAIDPVSDDDKLVGAVVVQIDGMARRGYEADAGRVPSGIQRCDGEGIDPMSAVVVQRKDRKIIESARLRAGDRIGDFTLHDEAGVAVAPEITPRSNGQALDEEHRRVRELRAAAVHVLAVGEFAAVVVPEGADGEFANAVPVEIGTSADGQ